VTLNYRVASDPNAPMYSPERDLAYVFPALIQEVFASLDAKNWDTMLRYLNTEYGLTEQDLADGCLAFSNVSKAFLRDDKVKDLDAALTTTGFREQPPLVQLAIFYRIGQAAAAGTLVAAKTLTPRLKDGGLQAGVANTAAAMYQAARQLVELPPQQEPTEINQADYWQARAEMSERLTKQQSKEIQLLQERLQTYESKYGDITSVPETGGESGVPQSPCDRCDDCNDPGVCGK